MSFRRGFPGYHDSVSHLNQTNVLNIVFHISGKILLAKKHKSSREIQEALDHLYATWEGLLKESENRGRGLEEAQDILEFNNQLEKIEAWIRDKVRL